MFLHEQDARPDLHYDYDELQIKPIQQQQTAQATHRSNAKTSFGPGAGNRWPVAASYKPNTLHNLTTKSTFSQIPLFFRFDHKKQFQRKNIYIQPLHSHSMKALN